MSTNTLRETLKAHLEIAIHDGKWEDCVKHATQIAITLGDNPQAAAVYVSQAQVFASMAETAERAELNKQLAAFRAEFTHNGQAMVKLKAEHNQLVDESLKPLRDQ